MAVLQKLSVKGGVGRIIEYAGEGVKTLSVPERATITNMGTELGATTSIFPSDEITKAFLEAQGRGDCWVELKPDEDAVYDEVMDLDLSALEPLAACPHSPDAVKSVGELGPIHIDQCCIGSCTQLLLSGHDAGGLDSEGQDRVHPDVDLTIGCGSKQVYNMLALNGALADIIAAGARVLECTCGPCIAWASPPGPGACPCAPSTGTSRAAAAPPTARVYLVSPETAAASALAGVLTDPRTLGDYEPIALPEQFLINDNMILPPAPESEMDQVEISGGPTSSPSPCPRRCRSPSRKGDSEGGRQHHHRPHHARGGQDPALRSNIPYLSQFCFGVCDKEFPERCKAAGGGIIIGGSNYGQGSSREHAALVPLYLGVKAVVAKSYARIHCANLANAGLIPYSSTMRPTTIRSTR